MRLLAAVLLAAFCSAAFAQLRPIPANAKYGVMRHLQVMVIEIDGKQEALAPGAQIRDVDNRVVLPSAVPPKTAVRYLRDMHGQVHRVWILSPEEAKKH